MGTYQLFSAGGEIVGGMLTKPQTMQIPFWLYYFNVSDIDAAAQRVRPQADRFSAVRSKYRAAVGLSSVLILRAPSLRWKTARPQSRRIFQARRIA